MLTAGWRNAEVGNLEAMSRDFPGVRRVLLEENYRSTKSILQAAVQVMRQDTQRIDKDLFTMHTQGAPVMLRSCADAEEEADFLAHEIARQVQCSKGLLTYADVCILLRFNALSRTVEGALQRLGIPYRIMGGMRFFDRAEIKDLLAYLLVVDNPQYSPGVVRIINVPRRGIGAKGIQSLLRMADEARMPLLPWMECAAAQPPVGLRPAVLQAIRSFVHSIEQVRQAAKQVRTSYLLRTCLWPSCCHCSFVKFGTKSTCAVMKTLNPAGKTCRNLSTSPRMPMRRSMSPRPTRRLCARFSNLALWPARRADPRRLHTK